MGREQALDEFTANHPEVADRRFENPLMVDQPTDPAADSIRQEAVVTSATIPQHLLGTIAEERDVDGDLWGYQQ